MTSELLQQIRANLEANSTEELLGIWKQNDREQYSDDAFEAMKQIIQDRNVALPPQAARAKPIQLMQALPETSGCPCMICCEKNRSLKYRRLSYCIGFLYWRHRKTWEGYTCNRCSWVITAHSLIYGVLSMFLLHPQTFFWTPVVFSQNLFRTFKGSSPAQYLAFQQGDLQNGKITLAAATRFASMAQEILNENRFNTTGLVLGSVAILCGFEDEKLIRQIHNVLLAPSGKRWFQFESVSNKKPRPDKKWLKKWARKIEEVKQTAEWKL